MWAISQAQRKETGSEFKTKIALQIRKLELMDGLQQATPAGMN